MAALKRAVIVAAAASAVCYLFSAKLVDGSGPLRVALDNPTTQHLLERVENFNFKGTWVGIDPHFHAPNSKGGRGSAALRVFPSNQDLGHRTSRNLTVESDFVFGFLLRLDDTAATGRRHEHLFRIPASETLDTPLRFSRRMTVYTEHSLVSCNFEHTLTLHKDAFLLSHELSDLRFSLSLNSTDPGCQTAVNVTLGFDEEMSHRRVVRFLVAAFALGAFELTVIVATAASLRGFEYNFRFQSATFWGAIAGLSCLQCFVLISVSTDHVSRLGIFLLAATLHFTNFGLLVVQIMTPHAQILGFSARFGTPTGRVATMVFRAKRNYFTKATVAVMFTVALGMSGFPSAAVMAAIPLAFSVQILLTAKLNERFFMDSMPGFAICLAKLFFCVS